MWAGAASGASKGTATGNIENIGTKGVRTGNYEGKAVSPDETTFLYSERGLEPKTGGSITGPIEQPRANATAEDVRSLARQEEAAKTLSEDYGINVERLANNQGAKGTKQPDLRINGEVADVYSPKTGNVQTVWDQVAKKTNPSQQQASNIVVNLADTSLSASEITQFLQRNPIPGLKKLIILKDGKASVLEP